MQRRALWAKAAITALCATLFALWIAHGYQLIPLPFPRLQHPPPVNFVLGEVAHYEDELFAYLMFQYLRSHAPATGPNTLIGYERQDGRIVYSIYILFDHGLQQAIGSLFPLAHRYTFLTPIWRAITEQRANELRWQTSNLLGAYSHPSNRDFHHLSERELLSYASRFIRFKSQTDPRVRRGLPDAPAVLSLDQARELSRDILAVAGFFDLPLEFFLGIGAMENNYMNVTGDLDHAVWKRRVQPGDVVLRRRRGRALVLNPASGVWQITRETLRWAHRLYEKDTRDYTQLPEHLRPAPKLDFETLDPRVLTTYAGLFFRHLLDRFEGDVAKAIGAYNGGPGNPNPRYEAGVREVAGQARRIMEQAAGLRGAKVAGMQFLSSVPQR